MTTQDALWTAAALALVAAALATFAEHRRNRRRDLDRVGWVPWNFLQIAAAFAALICAILAMRS